MENLAKYIKINLLIVLAYIVLLNVWINATSGNNDASITILVVTIFPIAIHIFVLVCGIFNALYNSEKKDALALLLTAIIVLIVGFSSCWGSASITF